MNSRNLSTMDRNVKAAMIGVVGFLMLLYVWMFGHWWMAIFALAVPVELYRSSTRAAAVRDERTEHIEMMASHLCRQLTILVVMVVWVMTLAESRPLRPWVWPEIILITLFAPLRGLKWYLGLREESDSEMISKSDRILKGVTSLLILCMIVFLLSLTVTSAKEMGYGLKDIFFVVERPTPVMPDVSSDGVYTVLKKNDAPYTVPKVKGPIVPKAKTE